MKARTAQRLQHLIEHPREPLRKQDVRMLQKLHRRYPAFAPVHLLLARASQQYDALPERRWIPRAAAHVADRSHLRRLLETEEDAQKEVLEASAAQAEMGAPSWHPGRSRLDSRRRRHQGGNQSHWRPGPPPKPRPRVEQASLPLPVSYEQLLIQEGRLDNPSASSESRQDQLPADVIQDFLQKHHGGWSQRRQRAREEPLMPEPDEEDDDDLGMVSETLARIHARQGRWEKAIHMYRTLQLRQPEKSAYFAHLIQEVQASQKDQG